MMAVELYTVDLNPRFLHRIRESVDRGGLPTYYCVLVAWNRGGPS